MYRVTSALDDCDYSAEESASPSARAAAFRSSPVGATAATVLTAHSGAETARAIQELLLELGYAGQDV